MTAKHRDILKSLTYLKFSRLHWDVGNTVETSATSPKNSHIIIGVPIASGHTDGSGPVTYDDIDTQF